MPSNGVLAYELFNALNVSVITHWWRWTHRSSNDVSVAAFVCHGAIVVTGTKLSQVLCGTVLRLESHLVHYPVW